MQMKFEAMHPSSQWRQWCGLALLVAGAIGLVASVPVQAQSLPDFTELVERVGPAVVNIRTLERSRTAPRSGTGPEMDEDMLEFFRRFGLPAPNQPSPRGPR